MTDLPQSLPPGMASRRWNWNSWDSYGTTSPRDGLLANARFMAEHLKNVGWDTLVIDIDWVRPDRPRMDLRQRAPLILDEYGRQLPDPLRFPKCRRRQRVRPARRRRPRTGLEAWHAP